jgi:predicted PurR-regulated permease PerM
LYLLAAFVVVTAGVRMAQEILQLLLLSVFLAVVGVPVYAWLVQKKIASWLSLLIVISGLILSTVVVLWIVMTSLADFTSRQDHYAEQLRERTMPLQRWLEKIVPEKSALPVTADSASAESVTSEPHVSKEKNAGSLPGSEDSEKKLPVTAVNGAVEPAPSSNAGEADTAQQPAPETEAVTAQVTAESSDPENVTEIATVEKPDRPVATPDLTDLSPVFDPQSEQVAGWLQPRRVTVPPQSRRSWRELIASQFDPSRAISMAANIALSVSQIVSNTMLILLTVVFILLEASTFPKKLRTAFGDHPETQKRYRLIVERIRSYLVIKTAMSLLTGTLIAVWLWLFGVPYAGLWGMLAFLLNYIPNIGSIIAAVPALMVAWLDLGWLVSIAAGIGYVVVNMGVGNILEPRVLGRGMGLSALVVFCSMVFWGWALGPVGMLLSVPLTMTARVAFEGFDDTRWLGTLLGDTE